VFVPKKTDMSTVDVPYLYYTCEITMYISIHIETIFGNVDISEFPDILVCDKHTIEKNTTKHADVQSQNLLPTLGSSYCIVCSSLKKCGHSPTSHCWLMIINLPQWFCFINSHELAPTHANSYEFVYEVSMTLSWVFFVHDKSSRESVFITGHLGISQNLLCITIYYHNYWW